MSRDSQRLRSGFASSKALDILIGQALVPALRDRSFKRSGRTFTRLSGDLYHCVHVQASKWNTPEEAEFAVNLRVIWPRWHEIWVGKPVPSKPASSAPIADERVGNLFYGRDHWWRIHPDADIESLGGEVAAAVGAACDQFFPGFRTSGEVLQRLDAGQPIPGVVPIALIHATLLMAAGRVADARARIAAAQSAKPDWKAIALVTTRLGLAVGGD